MKLFLSALILFCSVPSYSQPSTDTTCATLENSGTIAHLALGLVSKDHSLNVAKSATEANKFLIPGGFDSDTQYFSSYRVHKYDQYLFFKHRYGANDRSVFILNWQTGKGQVVILPEEMMDFRPHWLAKRQQFIFGLHSDDYHSESIYSYDLNTRQLKMLHHVDDVSYAQTVINDKGESVFHYRAYNKKIKQTYYCRLK